MPIRRRCRWLYPIDWTQISAAIRFGRAKSRYENCGRPHGRLVARLADGRWWDDEAALWRDGRGKAVRDLINPASGNLLSTTKVVLATAHLDHDPGNNRRGNLKALCQRCHMLHDREEHLRRRRLTYRMRKAVGDLFEGRYPDFW